MIVTDFETWLHDVGEDRLFRFLVYKRSYTPFEQREAFVDQSEFDTDAYRFGRIEEAVDLGSGEWILGFREELDDYVSDTVSYYRLSEIRLSWREADVTGEEDEEGDWT